MTKASVCDRSIKSALGELNDFKAVVLILAQQGEKDPRFAAWSMGPEKGQALISDWLAETKNEV